MGQKRSPPPDNPDHWEEAQASFPMHPPAVLMADDDYYQHEELRKPSSRQRVVKGAEAAGDAARESSAGKQGKQQQAGKGAAAAGKTASTAAKASKDAGEGGKAGKGKGKGGKKRRRGKRGKGADGEGDYDYFDDDNTSFPAKLVDRMRDIHLVGGSFVESVGKSIGEASSNPVVDNVSIMDAADAIVLTVFLVLFLFTLSVIVYYIQKILMYILRKWLRIDPMEILDDPNVNCVDEKAPIFHKMLFFPDDDDRYAAAVGESSTAVDVKKTQVYRVLQRAIGNAKSSINGVLFVCACRELVDLLIWAKTVRKLGVAIFTDEEMARVPSSMAGQLADAGVAVKVLRSPIMVHHHYLIIDNRLLFNGSFNWTRQAVGFNIETMFITNDQSIVIPYRAHMSRMGALSLPLNSEAPEEHEIGDRERHPCADYDPKFRNQ